MDFSTRESESSLDRQTASASEMRWLIGVGSVLLAAASLALTLEAHAVVHPVGASCPLTEIWRGTLLAIVSLATAVAGIIFGTVGTAWARRGRPLCAAGLGLNIGFCVVFFALWM